MTLWIRSQVPGQPQFALVGAQHVGTGQGLEHGYPHDAGAIYRRHHVLQGAGRNHDRMHSH
jgi:hypothetical protein